MLHGSPCIYKINQLMENWWKNTMVQTNKPNHRDKQNKSGVYIYPSEGHTGGCLNNKKQKKQKLNTIWFENNWKYNTN